MEGNQLMANITITIPDEVLSRCVDAIAARHNYNADLDGTKPAFAKSQLVVWIQKRG